ncbi:hypothetical protein Hanom_Chr02g00122001 [Helianthus anomalus]
MDVDSAEASEKYVPDWLVANKDRVVDAMSVKMSLFHIGTPIKHYHYRKMSGPELGNALMFNKAQSKSLVVEMYKRWVEAKSNCRRFDREVATLKKQEGMNIKVVFLKINETQSRLAEVEEKWKTERHDMQMTISKAHQDVLVRMTKLVGWYEGETSELYGLIRKGRDFLFLDACLIKDLFTIELLLMKQ